jgi:molybdopterin-containing oxidoreductase family iron-sulfur binding subunit
MAACPYGSRSFNWFDPRPHIDNISADYPTRTKGVVEKCTFCDERLSRGQKPSCVEACSEGCLIFGDLNDPKSNVREVLKKNFSIRRKPGLGTDPEIYYIV